MNIFLLILTIWLVTGYIAGKAAYRDLGRGGIAFLMFVTGICGYFAAWISAPGHMTDIHGLGFLKGRVSKDKTLAQKFFKES